jgi:hypothetical protein
MQITLRLALALGAGLLWAACAAAPPDAQHLVDRAIAAHGGEHLDGTVIDFDFRGRHFTLTHDGGFFQYERLYTTDTTGLVREVLNNDGFFREVEGVRGTFDDEFLRSMESSVNSVSYFALLPIKLNDSAVIKTYLGETTLEGEPYHKVEVRFRQEDGGRDYEDWFVYWFHRDRHTMDYMSYYYVTDGGGSRFRKTVNPRTIDGLLFLDHLNYKSDLIDTEVDRFDEAFRNGRVEQVSEVVLENLTVTRVERNE